MSDLSYVTTAGSRRKRKNAVDMSLYEVVDKGPRGKGRPSKGGAALRAKRYYVKNHLMVLEKRKLKRYIVKVRKHMEEFKYNSATILAKLKDQCNNNIRRHFEGLKEYQLLYFVNLSREDQYLTFLNDEGEIFMDSTTTSDSNVLSSERIQQLQTDMIKKHSMLLFALCTLLSAYLLVHSVESSLQNETFVNDEQKLEKIKSDCLASYVVRYDHIIATYKDEEYQTSEGAEDQEGLEQQEKQGIEGVMQHHSECRIEQDNEEAALKRVKTES